MEVFETIKNRTSVRKYKPEQITEEKNRHANRSRKIGTYSCKPAKI